MARNPVTQAEADAALAYILANGALTCAGGTTKSGAEVSTAGNVYEAVGGLASHLTWHNACRSLAGLPEIVSGVSADPQAQYDALMAKVRGAAEPSAVAAEPVRVILSDGTRGTRQPDGTIILD